MPAKTPAPDKANSKPTGETNVDHPIDPKPAAPPAKPVELEGARAFLSREFPSVKFQPPKTEGAKDQAPPDDEDQPPKPDDAKPKPKKPAAPAPKPTPPPALTSDQIAEAAARGAVKGLTEAKTTAEKKQGESLEDALTESERRKVAVLRHMEQLNPAKYKDVSQRFIKNAAEVAAYAKKWEKENPGETFDDASPEHEDFYKTHFEDWEEDDFTDAAVDMRVDKALNSKQDTVKEEIEGLKKKIKLQESASEIGAQQTSAALEYWSALGEDFKDIVTPDGQVNSAKLNELQQADPDGTAMRLGAARSLNIETAEIHKVYNGLTPFQPDLNPVHRTIRDFGNEVEAAIMAKPADQRLDAEGKPFVTSAQYNRLSEAERARVWTLTGEDLIAQRASKLAKLVKESLESAEAAHQRWAKARGIEIPEVPAAIKARAAVDNQDADDDDRVEKPRSPSSASESRGAAARGGAVSPHANVVSRLL